jgi:chorismate dehydratase
MSKPKLRIGSVPYLNVRVLIHGLDKEPDLTFELDLPSLLAKRLAAGDLDVALVSSIEYLRHPEYRAVPGLSVSGWHEMWSIRLFHRVPVERIRTVTLDPASETTNALLRILLKERWGLKPEYLEKGGRGGSPDAFLLIGDRALTFDDPAWQALDLMRVWRELTGLPFVFALWQVRPDVDIDSLGARLRRCRDEGLKQAVSIATREASRYGQSPDWTLRYIREIVHYDFGAEERAGLWRFQEYLINHGLLDRIRASL